MVKTTMTATPTTALGIAVKKAKPTTESVALRQRQQRNFLATLLFSQGIPMILGGDESVALSEVTTTGIARTTTSRGSIGACRRELKLCDVRASLIAVRKHPVLRRRNFFQGRALVGEDISDILDEA